MQRFHYDTIDSTNCEARRLAAAHSRERILVTAATQSAGRGRQGRVWQSPRGGAWMSIAWPHCREPRAYLAVSLAVAVGVRRALVQLAGETAARAAIKWPNDLLIDGAKIAGILCEQVAGGGSNHGGLLIIGIGANVDFKPGSLTGVLRQRATTLCAALGESFDVEDVITAVCEQVVHAVDKFERDGLGGELIAELRENLAYVGTECCWESPKGVVTGRVVGVDDGGRLLLARGKEQIVCEVGELVTPTS